MTTDTKTQEPEPTYPVQLIARLLKVEADYHTERLRFCLEVAQKAEALAVVLRLAAALLRGG